MEQNYVTITLKLETTAVEIYFLKASYLRSHLRSG